MDRPEPLQIDSWRAAEQNAVTWMRHWGYRDARLTSGGADGGIDVVARNALAQVKFEASQTGRPDLQRLLGAARRDQSKQLIFICGAGYARPAIVFANDVDMALFKYDLTGTMQPVNSAARRVVEQAAVAARREREAQEQRELEVSTRRAERRAEKAELEKQKAERQAEKAELEKQKAERRAEKVELEKQKAELRKKADDEAISRGHMPERGSATRRVTAVILASVWAWKSINDQDIGSFVWCLAFLTSAVLPNRLAAVWPAVWPAWLAYLTYYYWMAPWPHGFRIPVALVFALATLLALILWLNHALEYHEMSRRVNAARKRIASQTERSLDR